MLATSETNKGMCGIPEEILYMGGGKANSINPHPGNPIRTGEGTGGHPRGRTQIAKSQAPRRADSHQEPETCNRKHAGGWAKSDTAKCPVWMWAKGTCSDADKATWPC